MRSNVLVFVIQKGRETCPQFRPTGVPDNDHEIAEHSANPGSLQRRTTEKLRPIFGGKIEKSFQLGPQQPLFRLKGRMG